MSGAHVWHGQFGGLDADRRGAEWKGGYQVVWQNGAADQYVIWTVDGNGNFLSQSAICCPATSFALESLEAVFQPGSQR